MWRYILAWLPMVLIAIANAGLRESQFTPRMDELRAHQVSTLTGMVLFGLYIWAVVRLWPPESTGHALTIGVAWLVMTVAFEFLFGHFVMGHPWKRLLADYDLSAGRLWPLIPAWIAMAPMILRGRS